MKNTCFLLLPLVLAVESLVLSAQTVDVATPLPDHIYVPYRELESVLGKEDQGVFLPYKDFQNLWKAARGQPAKTPDNGPSHLLSAARFSGVVEEKLARMQLELTVDILQKGWTTIPVGLGRVGVSSVDLIARLLKRDQIHYFDFKITVTKLSPKVQATGGECGLYSATVTEPGRNFCSSTYQVRQSIPLNLPFPRKTLLTSSPCYSHHSG